MEIKGRLWRCLLSFHYFINCIHRPNLLVIGQFSPSLIIQPKPVVLNTN
jgi:hypothetical protein